MGRGLGIFLARPKIPFVPGGATTRDKRPFCPGWWIHPGQKGLSRVVAPPGTKGPHPYISLLPPHSPTLGGFLDLRRAAIVPCSHRASCSPPPSSPSATDLRRPSSAAPSRRQCRALPCPSTIDVPIVPHERRAPELDPPPECRRAASTPSFCPFGFAGEVRRCVLHPVRASPGPLRPRLRRAGRRVPRRRRPRPCAPPATPRRRRAAASPLLHPPACLDTDAAPLSLSPTWYGPAAGHFFFFFYYRIIYIYIICFY